MVAMMTVVGDFPAEKRRPKKRVRYLRNIQKNLPGCVSCILTKPITLLTLLWSENAPCPHFDSEYN
jgi:hypothetical protein